MRLRRARTGGRGKSGTIACCVARYAAFARSGDVECNGSSRVQHERSRRIQELGLPDLWLDL
ncbi:putative rubredoxin [Burkholderia mallei]|nr:putative rubredoxin [Burkholderia mallei]KOT16607.1 putative rubredoxin [Burkholderia mallei]